jgi:hypothetical protein
METGMEDPQKTKPELPYDPAVPLLDTDLKECKLAHNRGTCTPIFIAPLLTITGLWNQSKCPPVDEGIKKM